MSALPPHGGQRVEYAGASLDRARIAMIMVHGRGASPEAILELVPRLNRQQVAYVAPAAAGGAWYPYSFLSQREANEPGIRSGLSVLESLVDQFTEDGLPSERVALLGFSQGACLASEFVFRHPHRYAAVFALSGGLIGPPGTTWDAPSGSLHATPIFLGCSDVDAHIPARRVLETEIAFAGMGATVRRELYPGMGHLVSEDEIRIVQSMLDEVLAEP